MKYQLTRCLTCLLAVVIIMLHTSPCLASDTGTGTGMDAGIDTDADKPSWCDAAGRYLISTAEQLCEFAAIVNGGEYSAHAILVNDIDLNPGSTVENGSMTGSPNPWHPISNFAGCFDGNGHTISGVYINDTGRGEDMGTGLFGSSTGIIKNLHLTRCFVQATYNVGGICGINSGTIENCKVSEEYVVGAKKNIGGICGKNLGWLIGCTNNGMTDRTDQVVIRGGSNANNIGGICGVSDTGSEIMACVNRAYVHTDGYENVMIGGIVGLCGGTVHGCLNEGQIGYTGSSYPIAGGICGSLSTGGTVYSCLSVGELTEAYNAGNVGIVIGNNGGSIRNCYGYKKNITKLTGSGSDATDSRLFGSLDDIADGQIAFLLYSSDPDAGWGQKLGADAAPTPNSLSPVYKQMNYSGCSATSSNAGVEIYSNARGDVIGSSHVDSNSDNLCDGCGEAVNCFNAYTITLGTDITVRFYARLTDSSVGATATVTMNGNSRTLKGVREGDQYIYDYTGVSPQCLGDEVTATLMLGETALTEKPITVTATGLCRKVLEREGVYGEMAEDDYKPLADMVSALLIYGGEAQKYVNYKTDALVSNGVTYTSSYEEQLPKEKLQDNGAYVKFTGASMVYNSKTYMIFYFEADSIEGLQLKLTNGNVQCQLNIVKLGEGSYSVISPAISAAQYKDMFTLTAYRDGVPGASLSYSIGCYANAMQQAGSKDAALALAAYRYGLAASNYSG